MVLPPFYSTDRNEVIALLKSDAKSGLSEAEAVRRLAKYGPNILDKEKQKSVLRILLEQFTSPIIWLLIIAGIAAFAFGEIPEGIAIIVVILINTLIGFVMELQAVRSMKELQKMGHARSTVIRDGGFRVIDCAELVPGDIITLKPNDLITADARVIDEHNLEVKEAALTGESAPVCKSSIELPKDTVLADLANSVFKGTLVSRGQGSAIVTYTGNKTELGKISTLAHQAKKESPPLDKRLNALGRNLIWLTLAITILILLLGIWRGGNWFLMIETSIALAVAAIPEGLPVIASITLARGMMKLARRNAIVKTLESVQTLGETNVIFTDKTGTLTENELYLEVVRLEGETIDLNDDPHAEGEAVLQRTGLVQLLQTGLLCNDAVYNTEDHSKDSGDPLEIALMRSGSDLLADAGKTLSNFPRAAELPFDEDIKLMGTMHQNNGKWLICVKGAAEAVLEQCRYVLDTQGNEIELKDKNIWEQREDELSSKGLRVLGFAYRKCDMEPDHNDFVNDLVFIGLGGFLDPARSDVKDAILSCREAGIKVIMVTGDHPETAGNIAEAVGLVDNAGSAVKLHSNQLTSEMLDDEQHLKKVFDSRIFARTVPAQKLELVTLYQKQGYIVGMTGDGVNDAPALKKADIGIAMGQRGTEVAKEVADIILKDDSFSSIVLAIRQGRIIFKNIRNFVIYLLSCNLSEIMVVGTAFFLGIPLPLLPLQILFLNMVTDVFPALALGMNAGEKGIMKEAPRNPGEPIISKHIWMSILLYGICMTVTVIGVELYGLHVLGLSDILVNNMAFYTLILVQLWNTFNLPDAKTSFFKNEITKNKYVWMAILISSSIVGIAWLIEPVRHALALGSLDLKYWGIILLFSLIPTLLIQLMKRGLKVIV
ncbi:MAG: cation-transporting P-type ATPase [Bacteroidetes bacterium]|nr:cation-transporting P-type ATPase [Bacteroidota bacterium]